MSDDQLSLLNTIDPTLDEKDILTESVKETLVY